jgi:hypothetical protein
MNAKTLKALRDSISHWKRIVGKKTLPDESIYSDSCPLCKLFSSAENPNAKPFCGGCPVAKKAGMSGCKYTPWEAAAWEAAVSECYSSGQSSPEFIKAAKVQLKFLKSLLPKRNQ